MDFLDLVKKRRSCRAFTNEVIAEDKLARILEAGRLAPTACNFQPLKLHVLTGESLNKAREFAWLYNAQTAVLVCSLDASCWTRKYDKENFGLADAAIVTDHMALAAAAEDVSSCIIGAIKTEGLHEALELPSEEHIQLILALGLPDESVPDKLQLHDKRKSLEELVEFNA